MLHRAPKVVLICDPRVGDVPIQDCYTDHPDVPDAARDARAALGEAMRRAGFVNYPTEWAHWSYGDRYWAMTAGASHAPYGPAELPPSAGGIHQHRGW